MRLGLAVGPAVLIALVLCPGVPAAQSDAVDAFIRAQMQEQRIPGMALAVVKDGQVVKAQGYGMADVKRKLAATPETVFRVASASKQFVAAAVMLLVQDGKLAVDDAMVRFIEDVPAAWRPITIRHLLTHTGGLVREAPAADPDKVQPDIAVIRSAYKLPLLFKPGDKHEYSNVGYFALAEIVRRASGRPWTEFIDERIFRPSGMHTTFPTNTSVPLPNLAAGYLDNEKLAEVKLWTALRPSGAFLSTVLDMAKWDAMLYTDRILSGESKQQMWTPATLNDGTTYPYGFGWQIGSFRGRRVVFHGGGGPGIATQFARYLDDRVTIVLLINLGDVDKDVILEGVAKLYLSVSTAPALAIEPRPASISDSARTAHDGAGM